MPDQDGSILDYAGIIAVFLLVAANRFLVDADEAG
jgi:hypothetical protein